MRRMKRRFQIIIVLLAWFMASGAQWDLVQTFAWGRMFATYSQSMPLLRAVKLTFTPGNMCSICKAVNEAKQQESTPAVPGGKADSKLLLVFQSAQNVILKVPAQETWSLSDQFPLSAQRSNPPTPPPRIA